MQAQEIPVSVQFGEPDNGVYDEDLLPAEFHKDRRATLRARLPGGGVAVVFSNPVRNRSNDIDYEYHQDPNFYYLSGHNEPNAMVFVFKEPRMINGVQASELLVVQPRDPTREVWNGLRTGKEGALTTLGFEAAMTGEAVSYTHLRAHETVLDLVCRLILEKKKKKQTENIPNLHLKRLPHAVNTRTAEHIHRQT